jgi:hypothetical protein
MSTENIDPTPSIVDGGTPTAQEALLAAQLEGLGDDPKEEPKAAAAGDAAAAADPAAASAAAAAAAAGSEGAAAAAPAAADPAAAVVDPPAAAGAAAAPAAIVAAKPEPPKDFDAEYAALQKRYDEGDIDAAAFQADQRALSREEGKFTARLTIWEESQQSAAQHAAQDFNQAAVQWEKDNADFMANPIRAQNMQQAIALIDAQTGGALPPAELFARAEKATFEAFGYTKPAVAAVDPAAAVAAAVAARKPGAVPATLATAEAAAPIESGRNPTFATLDGLGISELEDAMARMTQQQRDAYLADAPGAKSTLRAGADE